MPWKRGAVVMSGTVLLRHQSRTFALAETPSYSRKRRGVALLFARDLRNRRLTRKHLRRIRQEVS
jgi:hypothetical protein